jgi:hypothetical protein
MLSEPQGESAAVRPFDWPWDHNETIWPCSHCTVWRAEVLLEGPDEAIWIREWHAGSCAVWAEVSELDA